MTPAEPASIRTAVEQATLLEEETALLLWEARCRHFDVAITAPPRDERWELMLSYARAAITALINPRG